MFKLNCWTRGCEDSVAPQSYRLILPVSAAAAVGVFNNMNDQVEVKCPHGSVGDLTYMTRSKTMSTVYSRMGWGSLPDM